MGDPTRKIDAGGDATLLQRGCNRIFQLPVTTDERAEVLSMAEDGGEGPSEVLDALLPAQPADVADESRAIGK